MEVFTPLPKPPAPPPAPLSHSDLGDHMWRFELRRAGKEHSGHHPHFTCTDCGIVSCLPDESVRITSAKGPPRAIAARAVEVHLRGLCDRCD